MIPSLETLFCPCCTPVVLHALSQYGVQVFCKPLLLLGSGSLLAAVGVNPSPTSSNSEALDNELPEPTAKS